MADGRANPFDAARHRKLTAWAIALSCVVHAGGVTALIIARTRFDFGPRPDRLTDVAGATLLSFTPTPEPVEEQPRPEEETPVAPAPAPPPAAPKEQDERFGVPTPPKPQTPTPDPPRSLISDAPGTTLLTPPPDQPARSHPKASFAGVEASPARRIVYLVDASGAMTSSLKFVKEELTRSVARLSEDQSFQVIVFRTPVGAQSVDLSYFAVSTGTPAMTQATRRAKIALANWLPQVRPGGKSEVLPALRAALADSPDLVFVLMRSINRSVGFDVEASNRNVLDALEGLNPKDADGHRPARIKTIQFLDDDPTGLLQEVARQHGDGPGSYRLVGRSEVLQQERTAEPDKQGQD
ncbi:MAG: hypothetical protein U0637_11505 [Phycisphaerales bacterium]